MLLNKINKLQSLDYPKQFLQKNQMINIKLYKKIEIYLLNMKIEIFFKKKLISQTKSLLKIVKINI